MGFLARRWPILLGIAALAAVFSRVLFADLVWDDTFLIKGRVGLGEWSTRVDQLTTPFWQNSGYVLGNNTDYWRPLTSAVLWLGGFLFGEWPAGFHLLSLLAAAGSGAALVALLVRLLPVGSDKAPAFWLGLLFLAHPLCAEVACMVSNISDHLALLFLCLELVLLIDLGRGVPRRFTLPLVAVFSFLACCSKELGVLSAGAPLAAWMLARATAGGNPTFNGLRLASPWPWLGAAGPVVSFLLLRQFVIATATQDPSLDPVSSLDTSSSVFLLGFGQALERAVVPTPSGFHIYFDTDDIPIRAWAWAGAATALLATAIAFGAARIKRPVHAALGMMFALALVAPALLTVRASDPLLVFPLRYFHLPLAGFAIALLPTVSRFWTRIARFALPAIVCLLLMLSWVRIDQWKSDISLFYAEARANPDSAQTLVNLGAALCGRGAYDEAERVSVLLDDVISRTGNRLSSAGAANVKAMIAAYRDRDFDAASALLEGALKEDPTVMTNVFSLAEIRADAGHPEQAVTIIEKAIEAPWFRDSRREKLLQRLEGFRRRVSEQARQQAR